MLSLPFTTSCHSGRTVTRGGHCSTARAAVPPQCPLVQIFACPAVLPMHCPASCLYRSLPVQLTASRHSLSDYACRGFLSLDAAAVCPIILDADDVPSSVTSCEGKLPDCISEPGALRHSVSLSCFLPVWRFPSPTDHPDPDTLRCHARHPCFLGISRLTPSSEDMQLSATDVHARSFSAERPAQRGETSCLAIKSFLIIPLASCRDCGVPPHPHVHAAILGSIRRRGN